MSEGVIHPITMPKWGLAMTEGKVVEWLVQEGDSIGVGEPVLDVETDKIASAVEATKSGVLRRLVAAPGATVPVSGLLGVMIEGEVPDADIDAFIAAFVVEAVDAGAEGEDTGPAYGWAEIEGQRLRYLDMGEGAETVVLIHGFGGDLDNWLFNHAPLARDFRVIALDLPGHGQSSKQLTGGLASLASAVQALLQQLGVSRAHFVGHSMGGLLAQQVANAQPALVASLVLVASAGLGTEINGGYISGFVAASSVRDLRPVMQSLFADPSQVSRRMVDDMLKFKRLDGTQAALQTIAEGLCAGNEQKQVLAAATAAAARPVLVIWGEKDAVIPASHAEALGAKANVHVMPGLGHMVQMEGAQQVNELIAGFVKANAA